MIPCGLKLVYKSCEYRPACAPEKVMKPNHCSKVTLAPLTRKKLLNIKKVSHTR
jgi:hypothetical protein